jgi:hypothetical protein
MRKYLLPRVKEKRNILLLHGAEFFLRSKQVKKFPAFYGTRRFITVFTKTHYLSLS